MINYKVKMIDGTEIDYEDLTRIQNEVAETIIHNPKLNYLLKFETQLGKTRTAVKTLKGFSHPLIICPAKLSGQWKDELTGQSVDNADVVSINKLNLKDNAKEFPWKNYDIIIVDEFQDMLKSKTMKSLQKRKSLHLIGLSATPAGNDNLNYYQVAKTFFHYEPFVKGLTKQTFVHDYLVVDDKKAMELQRKGVKTMLPPTFKNKWARNFEKHLHGLIFLKRDIKQSRVDVVDVNYYDSKKTQIFTRCDGLKFFSTNSSATAKIRRMAQLCTFDWRGSFDTFKIINLNQDFKEELNQYDNQKVLFVTRTPALAYAIAEYLGIACVTGETDMEERQELFNSSQLVATIQTVGVGVSSLHHLEKIVLIEPTDGQATIEQLKGRIMNNAKNDLTLEIWH